MDDHEFLDHLYSIWAKTSGGDDTFWIPDEDKDYPGRWGIFAVDKDENRQFVGEFFSEMDADFVCGLHGCIGDLVRRMHAALDEADRADRERDEQEQSIYALAVENEELKQQVSSHEETIMHTTDALHMVQGEWRVEHAKVRDLEGQLETQRSKAGDVLWKIERPM